MASKQLNGSPVTDTSTRNNTGRIRHGGAIAGTKFTALANTVDGVVVDNYVHDNSDIAMANNSGEYNKMRVGEYVIRKVTTKLANLTNTVLRSGASDFGLRRAIKFIEGMRTTFLHGWSWVSDKDGAPTYTATRNTQFWGFGTDDAARPSLAVPGELVYRTGASTPTTDEYQPRSQG